MPTQSKTIDRKRPLSILFFAVLFFLCSADMFFTFHLYNYNFRWGQLLLLVAGIPAFWRFQAGLQKKTSESQLTLRFLLPWLPFFLIYGIAATTSASPTLTGIKWVWGLFNIGLAAFICLDRREDSALDKGFSWGLSAIAFLIWFEAVIIYIFNSHTTFFDVGGWPSKVFLFSIPIGLAQPVGHFFDFNIYRPNAFYYEPSYAGCALAFALFLPLFNEMGMKKDRWAWLTATIISAIILTSSRSGILSALFFFLILGTFLLSRRGSTSLWKPLSKAILLSILLLALFGCFSDARKYMKYLAGPTGVDAIVRLEGFIRSSGPATSPAPTPIPSAAKASPVAPEKPTTTDEALKNYHEPLAYGDEGNRLSNLLESFRLCLLHPFLGNGLVPPQDKSIKSGLSQFSMETWGEIALESGFLGLLTFLFAIGSNMILAWKLSKDDHLRMFALTAWVVHFGLQLFLTQTFPRLDYWLIFFLSIRLLVKSGDPKTSASR